MTVIIVIMVLQLLYAGITIAMVIAVTLVVVVITVSFQKVNENLFLLPEQTQLSLIICTISFGFDVSHFMFHITFGQVFNN